MERSKAKAEESREVALLVSPKVREASSFAVVGAVMRNSMNSLVAMTLPVGMAVLVA